MYYFSVPTRKLGKILQLNWALVPPLVERTRLKSIMAKTCFLLSVILNEVVLILPQFCRKLKLSQRRKERMPRTTHELPLLDLRFVINYLQNIF